MKENIRVNVIINITRTLVLTLLSFITFPWVCRYLKDASLGLYSWANTFVAYFLILAKVGIPNFAIRECVKVRDNKELLSNKVQMFFIIQLIATLASFLLMCSTVFLIPSLKINSSLIFVLALNFLTGAFSFEWVFIALEKQYYMSIRSIIVLSLSAILIIVFVTNPSDIYIYAFLTTSVTGITTIINLFYINRFISFKKTLTYDFKSVFRPLLTLTLISFIISLYNQTDTLILGFINEDKKEVASYSVGVKGIDIVIGVLTNLSTVFVPRSTYYYQKEDKRFYNNLNKYSMNICLFIVIPAIITMSLLSKEITSLISGNYSSNKDAYKDAWLVLIILSTMMPTYSIGEMIYGQILLVEKKEKYYLLSLLMGTLINVILSLIFALIIFKNSPAIGIAISTLISEILVFIFLLSVSWKYSKKALFNLNSLKILFAGILILSVSLFIKKPIENGLASLNLSINKVYIFTILVVVAIDAIIYIATLLIMKEKLVSSFLKNKKIKKE